MRRRLLAIGAACAALIASVFVAAPPASADPFPCSWVFPGEDPTFKCAYVIGVNPGSYLNIRSGPGVGYSVVGTTTNGQALEILCWTTGDYVNGYNIWTRLDAYGSQYVSDYYLSTGTVQNFLPHC